MIILSNGKGKHVMLSRQCDIFEYMEKQEIKKGKFKFIDLFAGIGGIRLAFEHVGGVCVFSSEWDDNACKTYKANFGDQPYGDITKIEARIFQILIFYWQVFRVNHFQSLGKKQALITKHKEHCFLMLSEY